MNKLLEKRVKIIFGETLGSMSAIETEINTFLEGKPKDRIVSVVVTLTAYNELLKVMATIIYLEEV